MFSWRPLFSLWIVNLAASYSTPPARVELFTSKSCRACCAFDKKYTRLVAEFPQIEFEKHELYADDNIQKFKDSNIKAIPCMLLFSRGEEVKRLTAVKKMFPDIEKECMELSRPPTHGLTKVHQAAARLCRDVYDDEYMISCESYVDHPPTDFQCSITKEGERLFVAVRGTEKKQDWKNNVNCSLTEYPLGSGRKIHTGYLLQWLSVQQDVMDKIDAMLVKYKGDVNCVTFCGHSAGAITVLVALHFAERAKTEHTEPAKSIRADCVTFGSPRLGNAAFKKHFEENVSCTRAVLDRDIVTRVPFWGGYNHVGKPIQIRDKVILHRDTSNCEAALWMALGIVCQSEIGIADHSMIRYCAYIDNLIETME